MIVVSAATVNIMTEHGNHIFVCRVIQVMHFIPAIQHVRHHVRWRRIDDGGGDDVRHVPVIAVLADAVFLRSVELSYRS